MEVPKAYGPFHLTFFLAGLAVSIFLARLLRNSNEKQNRRVLLVSGLLLLTFEIYKQLFQYYAIGYERYPFGIFPFHICSTPMYLCLVAALIPSGRFQRALFNYIGTFGFIGGFISWFEPSGLSHGYWVQTLHSYIWHMILIFVGLHLGFSGRVAANKKDFRDAAIVFVGLCCAAFAVNLLFWNTSGGTINMFFVGPANSSLIVFKDISQRFGWYVNTPLYMGSMIFAAFIVHTIYRKRNQTKLTLAMQTV